MQQEQLLSLYHLYKQSLDKVLKSLPSRACSVEEAWSMPSPTIAIGFALPEEPEKCIIFGDRVPELARQQNVTFGFALTEDGWVAYCVVQVKPRLKNPLGDFDFTGALAALMPQIPIPKFKWRK